MSDLPFGTPHVVARTRVKICGITRVHDLLDACALGADAVGFVCYPRSPRYVGLERLQELARELPPFVTPVLLFVDAAESDVRRALEVVPQALLQFHGSEPALVCDDFERPYLRAVSMAEGVDLLEWERGFPRAAGLLADAPTAAHGGSGKTFPWQRLPARAHRALPLVLAGGLNDANVGEAIAVVRPHAVDVSSGVEESHGIKSPQRLRRFFAALARADALIGVP